MGLQVVLIGAYNFRQMKCGKWSDLGWWLLYMTPFWVAQLITSLYAFKVTSVSTIQIIRSILPLMSFAMEKTLYGNPKVVSGALIGSMALVIVGTTLYGYSSASATAVALMWIFTNSVFTVVATVFRSKFMKDKNFTVSLPAAMCSVSTTAVPCIVICAALTGETEQWGKVLADTPPTAWFFATISGLIAGCFSFLQFRCQKVISGTSDLMFQNFVKVFIIIMGIVAFGDSFDLMSLTGCVVALGGCALYGHLRLGKEIAGKDDKAKSQGSVVAPKFSTTPSDLSAPLVVKGWTGGCPLPLGGADLEAEVQRSERQNDQRL
jgi:drug/metabolite transporter (DMT)-like permease